MKFRVEVMTRPGGSVEGMGGNKDETGIQTGLGMAGPHGLIMSSRRLTLGHHEAIRQGFLWTSIPATTGWIVSPSIPHHHRGVKERLPRANRRAISPGM